MAYIEVVRDEGDHRPSRAQGLTQPVLTPNFKLLFPVHHRLHPTPPVHRVYIPQATISWYRMNASVRGASTHVHVPVENA